MDYLDYLCLLLQVCALIWCILICVCIINKCDRKQMFLDKEQRLRYLLKEVNELKKEIEELKIVNY